MIPILAGLALGAVMGGGIAALQKKNILQGALMGGIGGALGGAFMPAVAGAGAGASTAGSSGAGFLGGSGEILAGAAGTGGGSLGAVTPGIVTPGIVTPGIGAASSSGIGGFLGANQYALMGGVTGGMMAPAKEPETQSGGNIYDMSFNQQQNPEFGQVAGAPAFMNQGYKTNSITPVEDYKPTMMAANGGIIALAEGGDTGVDTSPITVDAQRYAQPVRQVDPAVAAYNAQLMARANQQYNVNPRPLANMVPGTAEYIASRPAPAPAASTASTAPSDSISGITYNPMTGRFEGEFIAPDKAKKSDSAGGAGGGYDPYGSNFYSMDSSGDVGANDMGDNTSDSDAGGAGMGGDGSWANGGLMRGYNMGGGISALGSYSDGGQLLRGPGDGVSDDIPAQIGRKQPARLADGEFVVPARVVSELGNGSTDAGAKQLYAMMDRVQKNRKKSIGKGKVAVDAKSRKHLPA